MRTLCDLYEPLEDLPRSLFVPIVTHPIGDLWDRTEAVLRIRKNLLEGRTTSPDGIPWPPRPLRDRILEVLRDLRLPDFCRDQPDLVDRLLLDILDLVTRADRGEREIFRSELERLVQREEERIRQATPEAPYEITVVEVDEETHQGLVEEARRIVQERSTHAALKEFRMAWSEQVRLWTRVGEIFGALGKLLGRGWDLARGVLATQGWMEVDRLNVLLKRTPELREIIQALGRLQTSITGREEDSLAQTVLAPLGRAGEEWAEIRDPLVPSETRGVTLSDDITRMIPSETVFFGHPKLRTLWYARWAERRLATYQVEGVMPQRIDLEHPSGTKRKARHRASRRDRGPIILCLDTSGSMEGMPETVAKAVAIECLRIAQAEKRGCHVFLFGGPEEIVERELDLSPESLRDFVRFLGQSFHGGTEVAGPLRRALGRVEEEGWHRADILLVTDGEFPEVTGVREEMERARERWGLRVQGLLISRKPSPAMEALCDAVHRYFDWRAVMRGLPERR